MNQMKKTKGEKHWDYYWRHIMKLTAPYDEYEECLFEYYVSCLNNIGVQIT